MTLDRKVVFVIPNVYLNAIFLHLGTCIRNCLCAREQMLPDFELYDKNNEIIILQTDRLNKFPCKKD